MTRRYDEPSLVWTSLPIGWQTEDGHARVPKIRKAEKRAHVPLVVIAFVAGHWIAGLRLGHGCRGTAASRSPLPALVAAASTAPARPRCRLRICVCLFSIQSTIVPVILYQ